MAYPAGSADSCTNEVTHRRQGVSSDPIFIAPYNAPVGQVGAVIVDNDGQPIWENPLAGKVTTNFQVQSYRGSPVLTWWEGLIEYGHGVGEYVIADASYRTIRRVQAAAGLRGGSARVRDHPARYGAAHELCDQESRPPSRRRPARRARFRTRSSRRSTSRAAGCCSSGTTSITYPSTSPTRRWKRTGTSFHINSVDLDDDGDLLISSRSMQTIYKLDRLRQDPVALGGKSNEFEIGPGAKFASSTRPPPARRNAHVFDNGATPAVEKRSRGLILELDEQAMTATLLHQYTHPKNLPGSQGSVPLLENGNVFVGWGEIPRVSEFDYSGRMVFDAELGANTSPRAFRLPWTAFREARRSPRPVTAGRRPCMQAGTERPRYTHGSCSRAADRRSGARREARSLGYETRSTPHRRPCLAVQALDGWHAARALGARDARRLS